MRPNQYKPKPKRKLIGGRLVYPGGMPKPRLVGGRLVYPQVMPRTVRGPLPQAVPMTRPIQTVDIKTQVQRDVGAGIHNLSAQDRINMAFKNMKLGPQQRGQGVRML